jgi:DNA polymerase-3 subunit delta
VPLHILYGYETFARSEALSELKAALDTEGALATNSVTFTASQATPQEVLGACNSVPFLGEHRLVVLEGALGAAAEKAKRASKKSVTAEDVGPWGVLAAALGEMPPSTTLVLIDGEVLESNALLKALKPLAQDCRKFVAPVEKQLPGWIMARAKRTGMKIEPAAAKALADLVGTESEGRDRKKETHLPLLAMEMEKLRTYADGGVVRVNDVRELVSRAQEHKGWALSDAIADRQPARATKVLQEMLQDGANEGALLSTIATKFRRMAIAREMVTAGASRTAIAAALGVADNYGLTRLIEQAETLDMAAISRAYDRLVEADLEGKSSAGDSRDRARLALEMAVIELASQPSRPKRAATAVRR